MNRVYVQLTGAVLAVCVVSAGLLGFSDVLMRDRIARLVAEHEARLRGAALVGTEHGAEVEFGEERRVGEFAVYDGRRNNEYVGSVFTVVTHQGYGGDIAFIIGVAPDGEHLTGIRVAVHAETPGLGANATEVRYGDTDPWFCAQFGGLTLEQIQLRMEGPPGAVDAITGATITSRAITERAREAFAAYRAAVEAESGAAVAEGDGE